MYLLYHFGYLPIIKFEFCQLCSVLYEVIELFIFGMFGSVLESCELTGVCLLLPWLIK